MKFCIAKVIPCGQRVAMAMTRPYFNLTMVCHSLHHHDEIHKNHDFPKPKWNIVCKKKHHFPVISMSLILFNLSFNQKIFSVLGVVVMATHFISVQKKYQAIMMAVQKLIFFYILVMHLVLEQIWGVQQLHEIRFEGLELPSTGYWVCCDTMYSTSSDTIWRFAWWSYQVVGLWWHHVLHRLLW